MPFPYEKQATRVILQQTEKSAQCRAYICPQDNIFGFQMINNKILSKDLSPRPKEPNPVQDIGIGIAKCFKVK